MKIDVEHYELTRYGAQYRLLGMFDYPLNHKFTPIEIAIIDRMVVRDDNIRTVIEWEHDYRRLCRLNRIFINGTEFRLYCDHNIDIDKVLETSQKIFDKIVALTLMTNLSKNVRRKIREKLIEIIQSCLEEVKEEVQTK